MTIQTDAQIWQPWVLVFLRAFTTTNEAAGEKSRAGKARSCGATELSLRIIEHACDHGTVTISHIVKLTGTNRNTLKQHCRQLVAGAACSPWQRARRLVRIGLIQIKTPASAEFPDLIVELPTRSALLDSSLENLTAVHMLTAIIHSRTYPSQTGFQNRRTRFREDQAGYLESRKPLAMTRHGQTLGSSFPRISGAAKRKSRPCAPRRRSSAL